MNRRPASKLTALQVREMRLRYAEGSTQSALAHDYHITIGHVGRIVRGDVWQTLESGYISPQEQGVK